MHDGAIRRNRERCYSEGGRALLGIRRQRGEGPFGYFKQFGGMRRMSGRGLSFVWKKALMAGAGWNLLILLKNLALQGPSAALSAVFGTVMAALWLLQVLTEASQGLLLALRNPIALPHNRQSRACQNPHLSGGCWGTARSALRWTPILTCSPRCRKRQRRRLAGFWMQRLRRGSRGSSGSRGDEVLGVPALCAANVVRNVVRRLKWAWPENPEVALTARFTLKSGGEGGIRTHAGVATRTVFKTVPLNRSGTSPRRDRRRADGHIVADFGNTPTRRLRRRAIRVRTMAVRGAKNRAFFRN